MERMKLLTIWAVIMYFMINSLADNPQRIQKVRRQMNAIVDQGIQAVKRAVS